MECMHACWHSRRVLECRPRRRSGKNSLTRSVALAAAIAPVEPQALAWS